MREEKPFLASAMRDARVETDGRGLMALERARELVAALTHFETSRRSSAALGDAISLAFGWCDVATSRSSRVRSRAGMATWARTLNP